MTSDPRMFSPSVARNREPILAVLKRVFPTEGVVLEIGSGSGEHASYFSRGLGGLDWQPSEYDVEQIDSINAHAILDGATAVRPAIYLDVTKQPWPFAKGSVAAILSCNMIHITPWKVSLQLMAGASKVLKSGGVLVTYGPYMLAGSHTSLSNEQFDQTLRTRNMNWGIRDLDAVVTAAKEQGLVFNELIPMPANNFCVVFNKP